MREIRVTQADRFPRQSGKVFNDSQPTNEEDKADSFPKNTAELATTHNSLESKVSKADRFPKESVEVCNHLQTLSSRSFKEESSHYTYISTWQAQVSVMEIYLPNSESC
jgi:hypothetical protein